MEKLFSSGIVVVLVTLLIFAGCVGDGDQDPVPNSPPVSNPAPKKPPVAYAGSDKYIFLPLDSVELSGSGTDADGSINAYEWAKLSGPESYRITNSATSVTKVKSLVMGTYKFTLKVTDNDGLSDQDTVAVVVYEACPCTPNCDPIGDPCNPWDY